MTEKILELFENKEFGKLKGLLKDQNPADLASVFEELPKKTDIPVLFRLLPKELAAEVFVEMETEEQQQLIEAFSDKELKSVLDELFLDDTVDIIEEMPAFVAKRIIRQSTLQSRKLINKLLAYDNDSAGSIMTTEYVDLKKDMTVSDAFARIRRIGTNKETLYTCYVTDRKRTLLGIVTARDLMLASPDATIEDIMETSVISVTTSVDREEVVRLFDKYDFLALPVVDSESRLVGIITVDDAIDVLLEETEEDISKMAAVTPTDKPYLKEGVITTFLSRIPWLLILMISATFTGLIIGGFEDALASNVVYGLALTCFMPMIMGTAGNSGGQSSVTVTRALSLGEVENKDVLRVVWKEIRVSLLCGITLALVNFGKIMLVDNLIFQKEYSVLVILVISITLLITVVLAKLIGCIMPIAASKIGLDPAVMASPLITTVVDALSLMIYFSVASYVLGI